MQGLTTNDQPNLLAHWLYQMLPLNLQRTTSSLAQPKFYIIKMAIKIRRFSIWKERETIFQNKSRKERIFIVIHHVSMFLKWRFYFFVLLVFLFFVFWYFYFLVFCTFAFTVPLVLKSMLIWYSYFEAKKKKGYEKAEEKSFEKAGEKVLRFQETKNCFL